MHESELTLGAYTPINETTDAETGGDPTFMDIAISRENLRSGELFRRFDLIAFPQLGTKYTGTDNDGRAVPLPAVANNDK